MTDGRRAAAKPRRAQTHRTAPHGPHRIGPATRLDAATSSVVPGVRPRASAERVLGTHRRHTWADRRQVSVTGERPRQPSRQTTGRARGGTRATGRAIGGLAACLRASGALARWLVSPLATPPSVALRIERDLGDGGLAGGDRVTVETTLHNVGDEPLYDVEVVDDVPETLSVADDCATEAAILRPGESLTLSYAVGLTAGEHHFGPTRVRAHDWTRRYAVDRQLEANATIVWDGPTETAEPTTATSGDDHSEPAGTASRLPAGSVDDSAFSSLRGEHTAGSGARGREETLVCVDGPVEAATGPRAAIADALIDCALSTLYGLPGPTRLAAIDPTLTLRVLTDDSVPPAPEDWLTVQVTPPPVPGGVWPPGRRVQTTTAADLLAAFCDRFDDDYRVIYVPDSLDDPAVSFATGLARAGYDVTVLRPEVVGGPSRGSNEETEPLRAAGVTVTEWSPQTTLEHERV